MFKSFRAALVPCFDLLGRQTETTSNKVLLKLPKGIQNACTSSNLPKKKMENPKDYNQVMLKISKFYIFEWDVVSVGLAEEHLPLSFGAHP